MKTYKFNKDEQGFNEIKISDLKERHTEVLELGAVIKDLIGENKELTARIRELEGVKND